MDDFGDDLSICSDIEDEAIIDSSMLLPEKSRKRYEATYESFKKYCETRNLGTSEAELMTYFLERAEILKSPSSLWCEYSMLKTTLFVIDNIDISVYPKLKAFLKKKNAGYRPKKSKIFTREEIYTFLTQAPDEIYLMLKVVLIMGLAGACRRDELCKMRTDDVEDKDSVIIVKIRDVKNKNHRTFAIIDNERENIHAISMVKRYMRLRPKHSESKRFFVRYHMGKCVNQVVGINTFAKIPSQIARYLNLEQPNEFTGHSFRRTSAALLANTGVGILGGWTFSDVIEDMASCGATDCMHNNLRNTCNFFRLPIEPVLRADWLRSLRRDPNTVPKVMFVCSCHFRDGRKENGPEIYLVNENFEVGEFDLPSSKNLRGKRQRPVQSATEFGLAKLRAPVSDPEPEPSTSAASNDDYEIETNSNLPIEQVYVEPVSTSCENQSDSNLEFLPESKESLPSYPTTSATSEDMKTYCRLCLNPVTKVQMICLGDFHDINYPSRTVQFKRNKILQTEMFLRMIKTLLPNFDHDLVYNPVMCNDCSTRLQMASDFVEQCMATQKLIQQFKDTHYPSEKMVNCEDVVNSKCQLQPSCEDGPSQPKQRKRSVGRPRKTPTVSYDEEIHTSDNVNIKTEDTVDEEMELEEKYEITQEEICYIKQEIVEEPPSVQTEDAIRTNVAIKTEYDHPLPINSVAKSETLSTATLDSIKTDPISVKQFTTADVACDMSSDVNKSNYLVHTVDLPSIAPISNYPVVQASAPETCIGAVNPDAFSSGNSQFEHRQNR